MLFKVDFEKAFDSVRWDYLDDLLKMFGFGNKWRGWINGCLKSAMGSVLVNENLTSEFKFHKGLKHGDPLSPFLFIMIMESLHLSFRRVIDAGLFSSISINNTLTISNLFYADDAVFVGKWDIKLMGIGVRTEEVDLAANIVGCSTFSSPFTHLGVKVGGIMSRIKSWDKVTSKEFFNGFDGSERKLAMISWNKVLAYKRYGGLGVSSFFAFNRALIFKWIWRFLTQGSSLWARLIKAIYGDKGAIDSFDSISRHSPWLDIIRESSTLSNRGSVWMHPSSAAFSFPAKGTKREAEI
ncbi:RNA-directed DNA polymerase, eukaryota [Tanacetum coccineum]